MKYVKKGGGFLDGINKINRIEGRGNFDGINGINGIF
jgi:hypothetical protein